MGALAVHDDPEAILLLHRVWRQLHELSKVASSNRQVFDSAFVERGPIRDIGRAHDLRIVLDRDLGVHGRNAKRDVHILRVTDRKNDSIYLRYRKPC